MNAREKVLDVVHRIHMYNDSSWDELEPALDALCAEGRAKGREEGAKAERDLLARAETAEALLERDRENASVTIERLRDDVARYRADNLKLHQSLAQFTGGA